jgi:drug/metabolite transporter (DMT)-like permease
MSATTTTPPAPRAGLTGLLNLPALVAVVIWGSVSPMIKFAFEEFPALTYSAISAIAAVALLFAALLVRRIPLGLDGREEWRCAAIAGLAGMGIMGILFSSGLARTSVSHGVLLVTASPLFVAGARIVTRRALPSASTGLGILVGFAGVAAIVGLDSGSGEATLLGDLLCLGGGAASAIYSAVPAPLVPRHGSLKVTAWVTAFALPIAIPFGLSGIPDVVADVPSLASWSTIVYGAAFSSVLANILWFRAIDRHGITRTIVYIYLEPVIAIALAALFLAEAIGPIQAIGGLLAIAGIALVQRD